MQRKHIVVSTIAGALLVAATSFAQHGGTGSQMPPTPAPHGGQGMTCR